MMCGNVVVESVCEYIGWKEWGCNLLTGVCMKTVELEAMPSTGVQSVSGSCSY